MSNISRKFHAAVNHVAEDGKTVLCRLKELGTNAPSLRLDPSAFGDVPAVKHESFVVEIAGKILQKGDYLFATHAKVSEREMSEAVEFDVDAYLAGCTADGEIGEESPF